MKRNKSLIEVNEISQSLKVSMRTRIISAIIAAVIVFPCVILGDWFIFALAVFAVVVGTYEIIRCAKPRHSVWLTIVAVALVLLLCFWPVLKQVLFTTTHHDDWKLWTSFESLYLSIIVLVGAFMISFFFVVVDKGTSVSDATFIFTICLVLGLGMQCLLFLRFIPIFDKYDYEAGMSLAEYPYFNIYENLESSTLVLYVVIATFATDIGAYFTGVLFGKHKMNERISPKKTWEGFFGGVFFSILLSFPFAFFLAFGGHPILSIFEVDKWYFILLISFVIPFFSTLGDFVFSSMKRHYGIKDFGNIMPGHGGVLDRIDSILFSFLISSILICIILGRSTPLL